VAKSPAAPKPAAFVAILMGSDSDLPAMEKCCTTLEVLGVPFEVNVLSAHRTPDEVHAYVNRAEADGAAVFVCAAGGAAHLAGAVVARTLRPVIGVPLDATPLGGLDALLATVQMPSGVPVATVAIGPMGASNAAFLAARILALGDPALRARLEAHRGEMVKGVLEKNRKIRERSVRR
jgi:5-(carboxyamino)imidazole ribonucleotide mutase